MARLLALLLLLYPTSAAAQLLFGQARAVDGDTLAIGETYVRLHGIDAVESAQTCNRAGQPWECGREAQEYLARLIEGATVQCRQRDRDSYGREVATCRANGRDLSQAMVDTGFAIALRHYSEAYVSTEDAARSRGIGIWASEFQNPADFRADNPQTLLPPPRRAAPQTEGRLPSTVRPAAPASGSTYYPNCAAARAAGVAPMRRGQPGYRPELDADGDGVACEPYRGR